MRLAGASAAWAVLLCTWSASCARLGRAGHRECAERVRREILGRNVIPGHWTFQLVEAYDRTYHEPFRALEAEIRRELAQGRDHLYEAELKERRRTRGHPDHTAGPEGSPERD